MDTSKIIRGIVNGRNYTVTAPIVKEDYGLYLQIEGVELPSTYEVDFSNSESNGTSVTMIGNSDGVLIPHQFIETGKDVFAFLYHVGQDFGRTVYKFRIPNKVRPDRTNEEPTPEEQSVIDQAISALNDAVEQTAQDVIDADASAQSASDDADRAEQARDTAQGYANNAQTSATSAQTSASQASASATASAHSASEAQSASTNAETYALNSGNKAVESAQSAQASANSATQAQGYAQSASASAQSASGYASNAQTSANTASNKASEASQSASQALTYKNDAEQAKTASQTAQGLAESARDSAISAKNDAESARDEAQNIVDGISGKVEQIDQNTADIASLEEDRYKPYPTDTASGAIASFSDGADNLPLKSLVVDINPIQDLSQGDPSPENICPISGWTQVEVNHSDADMTNPATLSIPLGQTVYGGHLDVLSGGLTVDRAMVDLGTLNWSYSGESLNHRFSATMPSDYLVPQSASDRANVVCSRYASNPSVVASASALGISGYQGSTTIFVRDLAYSDNNSFKSAVNGEQLVYRLATPIEIQLSANQINSLYGVNNIWADSGDTEAVYRADTKLYIAKKIAEAISALS